jgi:hypothetical protein
MKNLAKRLGELEVKQRRTSASFDHLTDEELEAFALDRIVQIGAAGLPLPDDWREQYDRSAIRFLEWLQREVEEMIACEA